MLGEPTGEQREYAGPRDELEVSRQVLRGDERGARERDGDRPHAPRAPGAPGAHADRRADHDDEEHQVVKPAQREADAEHGEQPSVGRHTRWADGAGEPRRMADHTPGVRGACFRGAMGGADVSLTVLATLLHL